MGEKNVDIMFLVAFVLIVSCVGISCADNEIIITSVPVAMNTCTLSEPPVTFQLRSLRRLRVPTGYPVPAGTLSGFNYLSTAISPAITGSNAATRFRSVPQ